MKLRSTKQITLNEIEKNKLSLLIAASGYEGRSAYISRTLLGRPLPNCMKFVLGFTDQRENLSREENDEAFKSMGFNEIINDGDEKKGVVELLENFLTNHKYDTLDVIIDYSCMTRVWYASILKFFEDLNSNLRECNIYFAYSPAKFVKSPKEPSRNLIVGPIEDYCSLSIPDKPTALIIGLGYITERAYGLTDYLDADPPFLFYGDASYNKEYSFEVELKNRELLNIISPDNIIKYPINDMFYTESLLLDLCNLLKSDYRIILAPCGPKIFTLISLIISIKLEGIDVWRISAGKLAMPVDKRPNGDILLYKTTFVST